MSFHEQYLGHQTVTKHYHQQRMKTPQLILQLHQHVGIALDVKGKK